MSVRVFVSYAHEDRAWCERLLDHLGWLRHSGQLAVFDDQQIKPGEQWDARIRGELAGASIVFPLISPSFIGSRYCSLDELMEALQGGKRLIPVLVDHVDLEALPVAAIQCLPKDEQQDLMPLVDWPNPNRALAAVAAVIRKAMAEFAVDAGHATQSLVEVTIHSDVGRIDHGMAAVYPAATPRPVDAAEISPANQALGKGDGPIILPQAAAEDPAGDTGTTGLLAVSDADNTHALETAAPAGQLAPAVSIPARREADADPAPPASGKAGPTEPALSARATHSAPLDAVSTKQVWSRKVGKAGWCWLGMILILCTISAGGYAYWAFSLSGKPLVLRGHEGTVFSVGFSPDGPRIVTGSADMTARVWQADGTGEALILHGHEGTVFSASFSPDGTRIVTGSDDMTARVWQADGTGEALILRGHEGTVRSASFSQDGKRIVTGSWDETARVWPADGTGEPVVLRHEDEVKSAAFSPDGTRIVTGSADKTARVWRADGRGKPVLLRGHEQDVTSASFSPDGKRIVTSSLDGTARVWRADAGGPTRPSGHSLLGCVQPGREAHRHRLLGQNGASMDGRW